MLVPPQMGEELADESLLRFLHSGKELYPQRSMLSFLHFPL